MSIGHAPCSHRVNQSKRLVESLELLLAHTIRENPDISMERFAAGLPRKNSAPPITLGPAIVDREPDRSAFARKAETPKQPSLCLRLRAPYLYPDHSGSLTELENLSGDVKGKGTSGETARPKVPMCRAGADCLVVAVSRRRASVML